MEGLQCLRMKGGAIPDMLPWRAVSALQRLSLLAVGMLPYYLSQEFSSAIPLSAHGVVACDITHLTVVDL